MSCEEIEIQILDYQENLLSPTQRAEVETHLTRCAGCRSFSQGLQQLEAILSAEIKVPALPADFDDQLRQRILAVPMGSSAAQRAERKRQAQTEYEAGLARISRGSFGLGNLLEHLSWPILAALAGCLAWRITSQLATQIHAESLGGVAPDLLPWLAASIVVLAVGLGEVFPRRWGSLRQW